MAAILSEPEDFCLDILAMHVCSSSNVNWLSVNWKAIRNPMVEKGAAKVWRVSILFSKKIFKVNVASLYPFSLRGTFEFCQRCAFPVGDFMHCFPDQCTTPFHMKFL